MKENYEDRARFYLTRRTPVIIRVDGRAFHSFLRAFTKPFSFQFHSMMLRSAIATTNHMLGFKAAYLQSDEVSFLLTDYDNLNTQAWFDYNKSKLESLTASLMTGYFISELRQNDISSVVSFDARAFNIPPDEISNYFLWRMKDWQRNSVSMYARSFFSHKKLAGKNLSCIHELLKSVGKDWSRDLIFEEKYGTFIVLNNRKKEIVPCKPNFTEIDSYLTNLGV
jgi:tRNA(His) 5'-end guanylyltransferase